MNQLVAWLWQGAVLATVTTVAVRAVPPEAAGKRHCIWGLALVLTVLLPFIDAFAASAIAGLDTAAAAPTSAGGLTFPLPPAWVILGGFALWGVAATVDLCRLALGLRRLRQLVSWSLPLDSDRADRLPRWCERQASGRGAQVRISGEISGACAIGFGRPTILVSAGLAAALNDEALESIILHEHAHLQRYDDWARAVQCVLLGVARWHPAVRWISRRIDVEREIAADQFVVARDRSALAYARNLAEAAEHIAGTPGAAPMLAPGHSITGPMLRLRVERLLEPVPVRSHAFEGWKAAGAAATVVTIAIGLLSAPQLITFTERVARVAALASSSFRSGRPQVLPSVLPGRAEIGGLGDAAVASPAPTAVALSAPAPLAIEETLLSSAVHEAVSPGTRPGEPSVTRATAEHLSSNSISLLMQIPDVEALRGIGVEAADVDWAAFGRTSAAAGMAVAKAGTATGLAASRASISVSRFFKNGGMAIARTF